MGREYIIDENRLARVIDIFADDIYGDKLRMEHDGEGYLRFFSRGPEPPYHRNAWGRLWLSDDRLIKRIEGVMGVSREEALEMISIYFSKTYDVSINDAKFEYDLGIVNYSPFDDENYLGNDSEDEDDFDGENW